MTAGVEDVAKSKEHLGGARGLGGGVSSLVVFTVDLPALRLFLGSCRDEDAF